MLPQCALMPTVIVISGVIAPKNVNSLAPGHDIADLGTHRVEKISIMRSDDNHASVVMNVIDNKFSATVVEVVRGLVEEENLGIANEGER